MLSLLLCIAGAGADAQRLSHYSLSEWKHDDGLPSTRLYAIQQTPDGFLWLGTADGLVRFDGLQFVPQPLAPDGSQILGQVVALAASEAGELFAGTLKGGVVRLQSGTSLAVKVPGTMKSLAVVDRRLLAVETTDGRWMLSTGDLRVLSHETTSQRKAESSLCRPFPEKERRDDELPVVVQQTSACLLDREGNRWFGTRAHGLYLLPRYGPMKHFDQSSGLTSENISALFEDREANIWVATRDGLNRLRSNRFQTIEYAGEGSERLPGGLAASAGNIWALFGTSHLQLIGLPGRTIDLHGTIQALAGDGVGNAILAMQKALLTVTPEGRIAARSPLPAPDVSLLASSEDGLWLYSPTQGMLHRDAERAAQVLVSPASLDCRALQMAAAGPSLWLTCEGGTILRANGTQLTRFALPSSISDPVNQILPLRDGRVWFATDSGLLFYDGNRFRYWNRQSGLPGTRVQWVRQDTTGNLWLGYSLGIAKISQDDLLNRNDDAVEPISFHIFDDSDGIEGTPEIRGAAAVAQTVDGSLWFTVSGGVASIDVRRITLNMLPPPVHIAGVTSNGHQLALGSNIVLPHASGLLEFSFSAPSLVDARKVEYRYRLEDFDDHWQQARTQRRVSYANLPAGAYQFHVIACNNDGIWNETGDSVGFTILPAWYQTITFRIATLLVVLLALGLIYRIRAARRERALALEMDIRVHERTEIARELHDHLLQEILAVSLQLELANATLAAGRSPQSFIERALSLARDALKRGRGALTTLRSDTLSWAALTLLLRQSAEDASQGGAARLSIQINGVSRSLSAVAGEQISVVVQEALRNAIVHTTAEVRVVFDFQERLLSIAVIDSGPGLTDGQVQGDVEGHYGIRGMRERAARIGARIQLLQSPGSGAEWKLDIPSAVAYASTAVSDHSLLSRLIALIKR